MTAFVGDSLQQQAVSPFFPSITWVITPKNRQPHPLKRTLAGSRPVETTPIEEGKGV